MVAFSEREQTGLKIDVLVSQPEFVPDVIPMSLNGARRDIQQPGYLLAALTAPDQIGYLNFGPGEAGIYGGRLLQEWRDDLVQP